MGEHRWRPILQAGDWTDYLCEGCKKEMATEYGYPSSFGCESPLPTLRPLSREQIHQIIDRIAYTPTEADVLKTRLKPELDFIYALKMEKSEVVRLSKKLSYFLRHHPEELRIKLDIDGWANTDVLVRTLQINTSSLRYVVEHTDKKRFELSGDASKIRALYGHSAKQSPIKMKSQEPPEVLYHATTHDVIATVLEQGLSPMRRLHVHYTPDKELAIHTAGRKQKKVTLLKVRALTAFRSGHAFHKGNDDIWLSGPMPAKFLEVVP